MSMFTCPYINNISGNTLVLNRNLNRKENRKYTRNTFQCIGMHLYQTIKIKLLPCGDVLLLPLHALKIAPLHQPQRDVHTIPHDCSLFPAIIGPRWTANTPTTVWCAYDSPWLFLVSSNHRTTRPSMKTPNCQYTLTTVWCAYNSPWSDIVSFNHWTTRPSMKTSNCQHTNRSVMCIRFPHDQALFPSIIGPPDHRWKGQTANTPTTVWCAYGSPWSGIVSFNHRTTRPSIKSSICGFIHHSVMCIQFPMIVSLLSTMMMVSQLVNEICAAKLVDREDELVSGGERPKLYRGWSQ